MKDVDTHLGDVLHCRREGDGTTEGSILIYSWLEKGCDYLAWLSECELAEADLLRRRVPSLEVEPRYVRLQWGALRAVHYEAVGDE